MHTFYALEKKRHKLGLVFFLPEDKDKKVIATKMFCIHITQKDYFSTSKLPPLAAVCQKKF